MKKNALSLVVLTTTFFANFSLQATDNAPQGTQPTSKTPSVCTHLFKQLDKNAKILLPFSQAYLQIQKAPCDVKTVTEDYKTLNLWRSKCKTACEEKYENDYDEQEKCKDNCSSESPTETQAAIIPMDQKTKDAQTAISLCQQNVKNFNTEYNGTEKLGAISLSGSEYDDNDSKYSISIQWKKLDNAYSEYKKAWNKLHNHSKCIDLITPDMKKDHKTITSAIRTDK